MNVLDQVRASLKARADFNGDNKIDGKDIEAALAPLEEKARAAALGRPLGLLITAAIAFVVGCVVGWIAK